MNMIRLNITLPQDVAQQLEELAGPKKKSNFITETLRERIEEIRYEQLQGLLEEGYKASKQEVIELAKDFEPVDLKVWNEY